MLRDLIYGIIGFGIFIGSPSIIYYLGHWLYPYLGLKAYLVSFLVYFVVFYAFFHDMPCLGGDRSKRRK